MKCLLDWQSEQDVNAVQRLNDPGQWVETWQTSSAAVGPGLCAFSSSPSGIYSLPNADLPDLFPFASQNHHAYSSVSSPSLSPESLPI